MANSLRRSVIDAQTKRERLSPHCGTRSSCAHSTSLFIPCFPASIGFGWRLCVALVLLRFFLECQTIGALDLCISPTVFGQTNWNATGFDLAFVGRNRLDLLK